MKRSIEIRTNDDRGSISISAVIDTKNYPLSRDEVERVRDQLADDLMRAVGNVPYMGVPLSRVKVR